MTARPKQEKPKQAKHIQDRLDRIEAGKEKSTPIGRIKRKSGGRK